jgi:hypothetical protein
MWVLVILVHCSSDSFVSRFEDLPHRLDQGVLGEGFQQKGIGARFSRPAGRCQDAEDQNGGIPGSGIRFDLAAERQPIERGNEDLGNDDIGDDHPSLLEGTIAVLLELDGVTGLIQEVRLELADMRISIDDQNDRFALSPESPVACLHVSFPPTARPPY